MKYILVFLIYLSFPVQLFSQFKLSAKIVDAKNGDVLPYASVYISAEYGTMSNLEGDFTVMANEDDNIKISYIGYKTIVLKASMLPAIVKMEQISSTLEEVTVTTAESILDNVAKRLDKERKTAKGIKRRYFCRTTESIGKKQEMIEAFIEAKSAISLSDLSIIGGRRSVLGENQKTALYNTNLHYMLEISPAMIASRFWKNVVTPLHGKNYKKYYESSYKYYKPNNEDGYYCVTLKSKSDADKRVIVGNLYVNAKDYRLIKFEGNVPFMSMTVETTNNLPVNIKLENSFCMEFSYGNNFTEVSNINYNLKGKGIQCECILYPIDYITAANIKAKKIGKNLVGAIDEHTADSIMNKYHNIIQRTHKEEIIASSNIESRKDTRQKVEVLDTAHTDNISMRNYLERLTAFGQRIPQEKVFIHMDNTCYFMGDTIWFSAYTRQTSTGTPSQMSGVLYVELFNHEGYMVERKLIEMSKGRGDGFFALNQPVMYGGFYELRACTRWQLNWGVFEHKHSRLAKEWFLSRALEKEYYRDYHKLYSRVFPVYDRPEDPENPERFMTSRIMRRKFKDEENIDKREQTLTFYPEGGELLAGVPCRVAFEAAWNDGEWIEGTLALDGKETTTVHRGRGVCTVTVAEGEEAEAVFRTKDGLTIKKKLPKARKSGVALGVEQLEGMWKIKIKLSADISPDSVAMTLMHEGNLCHFRAMKGSEETFTFGEEELRSGVNQVTVFDTRGGILADRLFFVRTKVAEIPSLTIKAEKEEYKPYERIGLAIEGNAKNTPVSLAVRDRLLGDNLHDNGNIMTEMLLASEIKGFIPEPGWYFEKDDNEHLQALDLLMMTQGWRRFEWKNMAVKGAWEITEPAEKAPIIMGSVFDFDVEGLAAEMQEKRTEIRKEEKNGEQAEDIAEDVKDIRSEVESWQTYKQMFGLKTNLKREVKVHAELVHPQEKKAIIGETTTQKGLFRIQLPRFYGESIFFLSAADTTKWKEGEKYTWIQLLPNDTDLPENKKRRFKVETSDYFVRVSFPYPNFTKKYNFYQGIIATSEKNEESKWIEDEDGTTQIKEVSVQGKRLRGLREFKESYPAYLIDAYEARNRHFDSGMLFAPIARLFVGDYGLETPYVYDAEQNGARTYRLYSIWGIDRITKEQEGIQPPLDSAYHPKYLRVYFQKVLQLGRGLTYLENVDRKEFAIDKYGVYTDYCPRLEGSKRYAGSNLPETYLANFPHPNEEHRVIYRDRRYILPGFAYPAEFYSPDYSKQTPPDSVKDYRRTLYWNPNLMLDKDGKATVTLYNNARTTQISVDAAGQATDGTLLWGEER